MTTIGDLGCWNVDVDRWKLHNLAPLFPGKENRWVLVRSLHDDPDAEALKESVARVFQHWFDGSYLDSYLTYHGTTRSGNADLITLVQASNERIPSVAPVKWREQLPGELPTVRAGAVIWLEVTFAYRGHLTQMPWPVYSDAFVLDNAKFCPVGADWMLDSVAQPLAHAPPEQSSGDKARQVVSERAKRAADTVRDATGVLGDKVRKSAEEVRWSFFGAVWPPLAVLGLSLGAGLGFYYLARGRGSGRDA